MDQSIGDGSDDASRAARLQHREDLRNHNGGSCKYQWYTEPMRRTRSLWAGLAALTFSLPIIWTLASSGARDRVETPIEPTVDGEPITVPFSRISPWGDQRIHEMSLFSPVPIDILRHSEIHVTFYQSDKTSRHPATGQIEVVGTKCSYEMQSGAEINNGIPQPFVRAGRCLPGDGRPTGELWLTVKMGGPGSLGLFTRPLPVELQSGGLIYVGERGESIPSPPPAVMGVFVDESPNRGLRRVHLLSYMWTGSITATVVWLVVAGCTLLLFTGVLVFPLGERTENGWARVMALRAGGSAFCFATALALMYAVAVPPLHAADETPFASAYGVLNAQPAFLPGIKQLALDTHFERIRFYATQRFRPRDIGNPFPYVIKFDELDMEARSSVTTHLWKLLGSALPALTPVQTFAAVRGIHALLFGAAVAVATVLLASAAPVPYPQFLCFAFLFVPSLPFFGMQFSETALLTAGAVLLAASLVVVVLDGPTSHYMGLPLGLGAAAIVLTTRSALPMSALVIAILVTRAMLGSRDSNRNIFTASVFWGGLAVAVAWFFAVVTVPHLTRILETATQVFARRAALWPPLAWALAHPWLVGVVLAPAAGWIIEVAAGPSRRWLSRFVPAVRFGVSALCCAAIGAIVLSLVGSLWWDYPDVQNIQSRSRPGLRHYVGQVVLGMATMFRLQDSSTFLSDSFWAGFGWLDTIPGDWFIAILVTLTAVSLIALLLQTAETGNGRRTGWLIAFACGSVATFAFYAFSSLQIASNLHGRYLMPWYVAAVAVFWTPAGLKAASRFHRIPLGAGWLRPVFLLGLIIAVHGYSLCFILRRYF